MIQAQFFSRRERLVGFKVSGHSMLANFGKDILCAAVSSAVQLTVNGIVEILAISSELKVEENSISLLMLEDEQTAEPFLQALKLHLHLLEQDYPKNLSLSFMEVE